MAELETKKKTSSSSVMPDWSQLPDELLPLIATHLEENCFDVVHARSVCRIWRSSFPFPSSLLHPGYTIPSLEGYPLEINTIEKVPMFLFRVPAPDADAPEFLLVGISRDESEDHIELPSPLQCSVKFKIPGSEPTLMNVLDCQVISLGYEYRINKLRRFCCAMLPLNNEGEFVVLLDGARGFLVFRSTEMKWMPLKETSTSLCRELFTFRGKFYANFFNGDIFVIDPYSLEATPLMALTPNNKSHSLVPSGNDELFLFEFLEILAIDRKIACRVSRLDAEAGKWVVVSDLGDRVFFLGGHSGNFCCSAKELPHCLRNSILCFLGPSDVISPYKYEVHTGNAEGDLNCWRPSRENRFRILDINFPVLAFRVES